MSKLERVAFFSTTCTDPYKNIATEYALVQACPRDTVILFVWQNAHSVIIGKNQNVFAEVNVAEFLADGGKIARRFSGGGAVYHDVQNLNFSFVAHKDNYDLGKNFAVVMKALQPFGIRAELSGRNDMTVDGKKFSGNAFLHEQQNSLHHGTLLLNTDVQKMQKYLNVSPDKLHLKGVKSVSSRVVNLSTICPSITPNAVRSSLRGVCGEVFDLPCVDLTEDFLSKDLLKTTEEKLISNEWIFGKVIDKSLCTKKSRFDWGGVEIAYSMEGEKIRDLVVFSDTLDTDICALATQSLVGKNITEANGENFADKRILDVLSLLASD